AGGQDAAYVSGYDLVYPASGQAIGEWLARVPPSALVVVDPGPLATGIPAVVREKVARRTDWFTCNADEAAALTGLGDPRSAASALAGREARRGVVVRLGAAGCLVASVGEAVVLVAGYRVESVDSTGAGDAHT